MCVIAYKPANETLPDDIVKTMFKNNPDGAGFMFAYEGKLYIHKGYMTVDALLNDLHKVPTSLAIVVHTRIGTSGSKCAGNTHPYPVTDIPALTKKTSLVIHDGYAFVHNGVLSNMRIDGDYNDSQAFAVKFLAPLSKLAQSENLGLQSDICRGIIEPALGYNNRIVIMDTQGRVTLYGNGWVSDNGVYYSNTTYKPYTVPRYYTSWATDEGLPFYFRKKSNSTSAVYLDD